MYMYIHEHSYTTQSQTTWNLVGRDTLTNISDIWKYVINNTFFFFFIYDAFNLGYNPDLLVNSATSSLCPE